MTPPPIAPETQSAPNQDLKMSSNDTLSKTIAFLRFPLIVMVVFIHTDLGHVMIDGILPAPESRFPIYGLLRQIISNGLTCVAVPLFFFISGFLFFRGTDFSRAAYGQKLKKRLRTLLIPYVFWNIAVFFLLFLTQTFLSSMTSGQNKLIADYDWLDWLNLFWSHNQGMPVCYQFWFIRDLMVVTLFAPIIYGAIRYSGVFGGGIVLIFGGLWLFDLWFSVPGLNIGAFFFFSFGAWFGIDRRDFTVDFRTLRKPLTVVYLALVVLNTWLWHCKIIDSSLTRKAGIVVGLATLVAWTACGIEKNRLRPSILLAASSFFVYAYHGMPTALAAKYWVKLLSPLSEWTMLAGYFLIPCFIVGTGVGIYALLRRSLPGFTALITGGR